MAAHTVTRNKKPAEATTPGGLYLAFSTTLSPPPEKDEDHALVHAQGGRV